MSRHFITDELDEIAAKVEKISPRLAAKLDTVSNTLDRVAADYDVPDWEAADEAGHQDSYKAENYHKVPVGKDSLSKMLGKPSPADWNPEPAEEGRVELQAGKTASKEWPFEDLTPNGLARLAAAGRWNEVARAARMAMEDVPEPEGDPGDPTDTYSTAGLPEAGGDKANDEEQEGTELQFYGTVPAGDLHMPNGGRKKSTEPDALLDSGRDPVTAGLSAAALRARRILEAADQVVAEVKKVDPSKQDRGPGKDVERDQSLGGMGEDTGPEPDPRMAAKKVVVKYPKGLAVHHASSWERAAKRVQRQGKLLTASKKVNYSAIETEFNRIVKSSN